MERYFKTEDGRIINLIEHTLEQLEKRPDLKIYVATDSQSYGWKTVYVTVIVYRYGLNGAHGIFQRQQIPRIKDVFTRLWKEAEFTLETAQMLTDTLPIKVDAVEFDYNGRIITKSSSLVKSVRGWAESLGYSVKMKPDEMLASKYADYLVRA